MHLGFAGNGQEYLGINFVDALAILRRSDKPIKAAGLLISVNLNCPLPSKIHGMLKLLPETKNLVAQLEQLSHRPVEYIRVDSLPVLASIKLARNGAPYHILQYRPSNSPLDYYIAQQVGIALRMFEQPEGQRFDFSSDGSGEKALESIIKASARISSEDMELLPMFVKSVQQ